MFMRGEILTEFFESLEIAIDKRAGLVILACVGALKHDLASSSIVDATSAKPAPRHLGDNNAKAQSRSRSSLESRPEYRSKMIDIGRHSVVEFYIENVVRYIEHRNKREGTP